MTSTSAEASGSGAGESVWPLLPQLGFEPQEGGLTDGLVGLGTLSLQSHGLELTAQHTVSRYMHPIVLVSGLWRTDRTLSEVRVELLPIVDSMDQLKALLAHGIGRECPARYQLQWLAEGHELRALLPWVQQAAAYTARRNARPHCSVRRPWLRLFLNEVGHGLQTAAPESRCAISFDGVLLVCQGDSFRVATPAQGPAPWPAPHLISSRALAGLPKRLMSDPVEVGVWEGRLEVGRLILSDHAEEAPMKSQS